MLHSLYMKENYLEAIYMVYLKKDKVRNIDIAREMNLAKSSVSAAIARLVEDGYILYDLDKIVRFTPKGLKIAKKMYEKHIILMKILESAGIEREVAQVEACNIEHLISDDSFKKLKLYFDRIEERNNKLA